MIRHFLGKNIYSQEKVNFEPMTQGILASQGVSPGVRPR